MVSPVSVSGWFFGTNPPWLVEPRCSRSPGETLNSDRVNRLHACGGGAHREQLCASGASGYSPAGVLRGRMPEVWRHGPIESSQLLEADRWRLCALCIGEETEASGRPVRAELGLPVSASVFSHGVPLPRLPLTSALQPAPPFAFPARMSGALCAGWFMAISRGG